ncbi:BC1872 family protein [Paenibacillus macerans]|uniref:BC1872 family protein n=1 Tax=Paenibacillus macerans TaxID=44252 RepID=UPI00203C35A8|nr:hypothetical protein [Paenibacillus macerans]MCM3703827.1 hypothetical protein [Paenibacillus macerans]
MTREEIQDLKGRALDLAVHTEVMGNDMKGYRWPKHGPGPAMVKVRDGFVRWIDIPYYSKDMNAAMEAVNKFDLNTFNLNWLDASNSHGEGWHCKLGEAHAVRCKTAPEAICKAALLAVLGEEKA